MLIGTLKFGYANNQILEISSKNWDTECWLTYSYQVIGPMGNVYYKTEAVFLGYVPSEGFGVAICKERAERYLKDWIDNETPTPY